MGDGEVTSDQRQAARELRNFANVLLNSGSTTAYKVTQILSLATRLDGNQPDERFSDIPYRLANPRVPPPASQNEG